MNKSKILMMLACMGLLLSACGGKPAQSSSSPSKEEPSSEPSSSEEEEEPFEYEGEEDDEKFIALPFDEADPSAEPAKWEKGKEYKWTFDVKEAHAQMTFAFGAKMSSSSHSDRSLYTNHDGASSSDSFESNAANDGTPRMELKVNGEVLPLARDTYGEAGLDNSDINFFKVATFGTKASKLDISLTTNADAGYRLIIGEAVRLYYPKAEGAADGYTVNFSGEHCKVYVYPSKTYKDVEPELATSTKTRTDAGILAKYAVPSKTATGDYEDDEVKPQVNFKVVCDAGYKVDNDCFAISGLKGYEWNELKAQGDDIYRITKIKADIDVTITPVADAGGETIDAGEITFALTNCTVKVYIGAKDETGSNVDAGPKFYSRDKSDPTKYGKGDNAQFNFEVVPAAGYKFVDGVTFDDSGEAKAANVSFISGSYNKLKKIDTNLYRLTKVAGDVTITLNCVAE